MYVREVQGRTLEFGHRGWLLDESFIFYDKQFDSLWVQATGECLTGAFKGQKLERIPVTHTTWGRWRSIHPETVVLEKPAYRADQFRRDEYEKFYKVRGTTFGLAVFVGRDKKLYPLAELDQPFVQDSVGNQPVLVVYHAPSRTAVAFEPKVGEESLEFEVVEITSTDVLLRSVGDGKTWSGLTGRCLDPSDSESQLRQILSTQFVVSNWGHHFPGAPTYRRR